MKTWNKFAVFSKLIYYGLTHASHDAHIDNNVGAICNLDADFSNRRADWTHRKGNNVECAAFHASVIKSGHGLLEFFRINPIVGRAGRLLGLRCDVGSIFNAGNIGCVTSEEVTPGALFFVEFDTGTAGNHHVEERLVLFLRAVTPVNLVGLCKFCNFVNPGLQFFVFNHRHSPSGY